MNEDDNTTFVSIGTPCDVPEENQSLKKAAKISDQIVVDNQGRRRFHGAFTGGFSAGYFNTVGSKEGWTPSTFVSSRSSKHEHKILDPTDFMDEDDFSEHGIAPKKLRTTLEYKSSEANVERQKRSLQKAIDDGNIHSSIPGGLPIDDLIIPSNVSMGVKLLKKMGWKPGHGIGEKLETRNLVNEADPYMKVYGCARPSQNVAETLDMKTFINLLPPKDIQLFQFRRKDNLHGIGYSGIDPVTALFYGSTTSASTKRNFKPTGKEKKGISGQAFGVGVFEEDDEDIYQNEEVVDYELFDEEDSTKKTNLHGWTAPLHKSSVKGCLKGFIKSLKSTKIDQITCTLLLPAGYIPRHVFPEDKLSVNTTCKEDVSNDKEADKKTAKLCVDDRSLMLGEKVKDKSRWTLKWDKKGAEQIQDGSSSKRVVVEDGLQKGSITEWERRRKLEDMTKANEIFRPLKGAIGARFTHACGGDNSKLEEDIPDDKKAAKLGMFGKLTRAELEWNPDKILCKRFNVPHPNPHSNTKMSREARSSAITMLDGNQQKQGHQDTGDFTESSVKLNDKMSRKFLLAGPLSHLNIDYSNAQNNLTKVSENVSLIEKLDNSENPDAVVNTKTSEKHVTTNKKPSIDVFKSIFDDSDSNDSSDEDEAITSSNTNQRENTIITATNLKTSLESQNTNAKIQFNIASKGVDRSSSFKPLAFLNKTKEIIMTSDDKNEEKPELKTDKQFEDGIAAHNEDTAIDQSTSINNNSINENRIDFDRENLDRNKTNPFEITANHNISTKNEVDRTRSSKTDDYPKTDRLKSLKECYTDSDWEEKSKEKKSRKEKKKKKHKKRKYSTDSLSDFSEKEEIKTKEKKKGTKKKRAKKQKKNHHGVNRDLNDSNSDENIAVPSNTELLEKLKKFSRGNKRPSAADFM